MGHCRDSHVALAVKNLPANAGDITDTCSIPGSGRCPGEGRGTPLQYSCLGNPMDRGGWRAAVHGDAQSQTRLSDLACTQHGALHGAMKNQSKRERESMFLYLRGVYQQRGLIHNHWANAGINKYLHKAIAESFHKKRNHLFKSDSREITNQNKGLSSDNH